MVVVRPLVPKGLKCVPDLSDGKSVEPMKFREPVPIGTGPYSPKEKEKNSSSSAAAAAKQQLKQQHGPTPT